MRGDESLLQGWKRQETLDDHEAYVDPTTSNDQAAPDYDIGSTSGMHNQDDSQASSMTYQNIDTQIVPYMTPQTPQYSANPHFSSVADVYANFRAEQFEHAPQFNSSPVPLSIELPGVVGEGGIDDISLEDASDDIERNDLDDANDYVDGNNLDDANDDGDTSHASVTIWPAGLLQRPRRNIKHTRCRTGSHYIYKH